MVEQLVAMNDMDNIVVWHTVYYLEYGQVLVWEFEEYGLLESL